MNIPVATAVWLDDEGVCRIEHLVEVSGLSLDDLEDLIDNSVIVPHGDDMPRVFLLYNVQIVRTARRLRDDFQLDRNGLSLAMTLWQRLQLAERRLAALQNF